MKKILTFIIIIAMTLSLGVPAFAATPATVTVASPAAAVNPGSTVDVAVTIADNPGMDVMKLKFSYDTAALTLKDIELGSVMTGTFTKNLDKAVALLEAAGTTNATGNGTLVTLKFEVKSTATAGNYTIGFLVAEAVNRNEERVALTTQAGTVSVVVPVTTYTVRFNANGGTGTMADVTGVPAGSYTLPANGFTAPAGKQFKGWSTGASGAVIEGTTYNVTDDVTLYAIWEDKPHTHTYSTEWSTDSANHWHECTCGDKKDLAAHVDANNDHNCDVCGKKMSDHTGGTATCTEKATCSICGQKYGNLVPHNYKTEWSTDETNHWHECTACKAKGDEAEHVFEWKIDREATVTGAGAKHEECKVCGYKKAAVAIDKLAPSITDGRGAKWNKGGESSLTFKSDAAFSDFVDVLVDGKTVAAGNYDKREGSIIIELKASYLVTLAEGEHTLTIRSASGDATTRFTIEAETGSPAVGVWVWIIIGIIVLGAGATVVVFIIRKRKTA